MLLPKKLFSVTGSLLFSALMSTTAVAIQYPQSVNALPASEVSQKLDFILVFFLMQQKDNVGELAMLKGDSGKYFSAFFLQEEAAKKYRDEVNSKFSSDLVVVSATLKEALGLKEKFESAPENKNKVLVTQVVSPEQEYRAAERVLKADGLNDAQISSILDTAVFYTEPMVSLQTSLGKFQAFFMDSGQLQDIVLKSFGPDAFNQKLKLKATGLQRVIDLMIKEPKDLFVIYPNPDHVRRNPSLVE